MRATSTLSLSGLVLRPVLRLALPLTLPLLALANACGGSNAAAASGATPSTRSRSEVIEHEDCDVSSKSTEAVDTNGDGKPDIRRVYDGSKHELCRVTDLNHDGKPDLYEYFDANGLIRRREFCYDDTGVVNAIETYQGGKLVERQYDTTGQHKIDTWDWFDPSAPVDGKTGRPSHPVRRERDAKGTGFIDQWWTWSGDKVSIATDRNGSGKPDPTSVIVLGGGDDAGAAPPGAAAPGAAGTTSTIEGGAAPATDTSAADGGKP
jgi:hypothetical protein